MSFGIPKEDVADWPVVSIDPIVEIDAVPLGPEFWKVLVQEPKLPNATLKRPRNGIHKIGQAIGHHVAWRSCNVCHNGILIVHVSFIYVLCYTQKL